MQLYRRAGSPYWWCAYTPPGHKRVRFSTKETGEAKAVRVAALRVREIFEAINSGEVGEVTLAEAIGRRLAEVEGMADFRTVESRARKLVAGNGFTGRYGLEPTMMLHEVTSATVARLHAERRREGMSAASIHREISLLRSIYNRARKHWRIRVAPNVRFEKVTEVREPRVLSRDEETALLRELEPGPPAAPADAARRASRDQHDMALALLDTGATYSEIATLTWDRIDTGDWRTLRIGRRRQGDETGMAITPRLRTVLARRRRELPECRYVFPAHDQAGRPLDTPIGNPTGGISAAMERAGINDEAKVGALGRADIGTLRSTFAARRSEAQASHTGSPSP